MGADVTWLCCAVYYYRNNPNSKHLSIGRKKFNMDPKKVLLFVNFSLINGIVLAFSSPWNCYIRGCSAMGDNM